MQLLQYPMINLPLVTLIAVRVLPIASMGTTRLIQSALNNSFPSWIKEHLSQEELKSGLRKDLSKESMSGIQKAIFYCYVQEFKRKSTDFYEALLYVFILSVFPVNELASSQNWGFGGFDFFFLFAACFEDFDLTNIKLLFHTGN